MGRPSEDHEIIVRRLEALGAQTKGFSQAIGCFDCRCQKRPDVFQKIEGGIIVHEVVKFSDVSPLDYLDLWDAMDFDNKRLELHVWSHHNPEIPTRIYKTEDFELLWLVGI